MGYEQLPLHLLITAFELAELGIDPYYFTLHITVDNAGTGHAQKAVQAVKACMPIAGDSDEFWQRVINGYQLNDVGIGAADIIGEFDLERELILMLERKRTFGQNVHSDFCSISGKTVNEWLSTPGQIPAFLKVLEAKRCIIRNEDPENSRFWRLIDGPKAPMAGVFSGYEKQLLHDWIAGEKIARQSPRKRQTFRRYAKPVATTNDGAQTIDPQSDMDVDLRSIQRELRALPDAERIPHLIDFMSPSKHATAVGLFATRQFVNAISNGQA